MLYVSLCIGICLIYSCDNLQKISIKGKALKEAVEFSGTESDIKELGQAFRKGMVPAKGLVWHLAGKDNLSSFLLTFDFDPKIELEEYEIDFDTTGNFHPETCLLKGDSLVSFENLAQTEWPDKNNGVGSFIFKGYGVSGKCCFAAIEKDGIINITKLAIAKKGSGSPDDGIIIFEKIESE